MLDNLISAMWMVMHQVCLTGCTCLLKVKEHLPMSVFYVCLYLTKSVYVKICVCVHFYTGLLCAFFKLFLITALIAISTINTRGRSWCKVDTSVSVSR